MSDDAFAPPRSSTSGPVDPSALSSTVRAIAVTAIVLGALSGITMAVGLVSLVTQPMWIDAVIDAQPPMIREEYRDLMQAQASYAWLGGLQTVLGLVVCGVMVLGGIRAMTSGQLGALVLGCATAAAFDVFVAFLSPLLSMGLTWEKWMAFQEAAASVPGASGGIIGALVGVAFSVVLYLGLAGFWGWAYTRVKAASGDA
jgi:hypothetical protein